MISENELKRRIGKERHALRRSEEVKTDFYRGMMHAFQIDDKILQEVVKESRTYRFALPAGGDNWRPHQFYQAICTALNYLNCRDVGRAKARLKVVVDKVEGAKQND